MSIVNNNIIGEQKNNETYTEEEKNKIIKHIITAFRLEKSSINLFFIFPALSCLLLLLVKNISFLNFLDNNIILFFFIGLWLSISIFNGIKYAKKIKNKRDDIISLYQNVIEYYGYNSNLYINIILGKEKCGNTIITLTDVSSKENEIDNTLCDLIGEKITNNTSNKYLIENFVKEKFLEKNKEKLVLEEKKRLEEEKERIKNEILKEKNKLKDKLKNVDQENRIENIISVLEKAENDAIKIKKEVYS